jgi:hypothetical protein
MGNCSTWADVLARATGKPIATDALAASHVLLHRRGEQSWDLEFCEHIPSVLRREVGATSLLIVNLSLELDRPALKTLSHSVLADRVVVHEADWALWRSAAATEFTNTQSRKYSTGSKEHYEEWRWILDRLQVRDDRDFNAAIHNFNRSLDSIRLLLHPSPSRSAVESVLSPHGGSLGFLDRLTSTFQVLVEKVSYLPTEEADVLRQRSYSVVESIQTALDADNASNWNVNRDDLAHKIDDWYGLLRVLRSKHA